MLTITRYLSTRPSVYCLPPVFLTSDLFTVELVGSRKGDEEAGQRSVWSHSKFGRLTLCVVQLIAVCLTGVPWNFSFNVKFYPPDPAQLSEDITRLAHTPLDQSFTVHVSLVSMYDDADNFFCLQVLPVSPAQTGYSFWSSSLFVCNSHHPRLLHGPIRAWRLWARYSLCSIILLWPLRPHFSLWPLVRLFTYFRWLWCRLHQWIVLCSESN